MLICTVPNSNRAPKPASSRTYATENAKIYPVKYTPPFQCRRLGLSCCVDLSNKANTKAPLSILIRLKLYGSIICWVSAKRQKIEFAANALMVSAILFHMICNILIDIDLSIYRINLPTNR